MAVIVKFGTQMSGVVKGRDRGMVEIDVCSLVSVNIGPERMVYESTSC